MIPTIPEGYNMEEWLSYAGKLLIFVLSAIGVFKYAQANTNKRLEELEEFKDGYVTYITRLSSIEENQRIYIEQQKQLAESQKRIEEQHSQDQRVASKLFLESMSSLKETIRSEFDRAVEKINQLLFEAGGTSRYLPRGEHDRLQDNCRADILKRLDKIEERIK